MRITYGIEVDNGNESYLNLAERALAIFSEATVPGKYLVETFPILRHLPSWFPGAKFKREAAEWNPIVQELAERPWNTVIDAMVRPLTSPSAPSKCDNGIAERRECSCVYGIDPTGTPRPIVSLRSRRGGGSRTLHHCSRVWRYASIADS